MKTFFTSLKIWAKTVFLNACFWGIWGIWTREREALEMFLVFLIAGFIVTAPLLLFVEKLVRLSIKLPYSVNARIASLFFSLAILIMFFNLFVLALFGDHPFDIKGTLYFTGITSVALLIAVLTTRKSLTKLHTQ